VSRGTVVHLRCLRRYSPGGRLIRFLNTTLNTRRRTPQAFAHAMHADLPIKPPVHS
jgi:hypothetical protein